MQKELFIASNIVGCLISLQHWETQACLEDLEYSMC